MSCSINSASRFRNAIGKAVSAPWRARGDLVGGFTTRAVVSHIPLLVFLRGRAWRPFLAFGLLASLPVLPWLVRNHLQTGNPVFPLLFSLFGGAGYSEYDAVHQAADSLRASYTGAREYLAYVVTRPFGDSPDDWYPFNLYPLYALFIPFIFIWGKGRTFVRHLGFYAVLFYLAWSLATNEGRHLQVLAPVLCLLTAVGYRRLFTSGWLPRRVLQACLACLLSLGALCCLLGQLTYSRPYSGALGLQSRQGMLRSHYSMDAYLWALRLATKPDGLLSAGDKLLFVHYFFSYGYPQECYQDYFFAEPHLVKFLRRADSAAGLHRLLAEKGIRYLVYFPRTARVMSEHWADVEISEGEIELYRDFARRYLDPVLGREDATIYEIRELAAPRNTRVLPGLMQILEAKERLANSDL